MKWQSLQTSHRSPLRIGQSMLIPITQHIQYKFIWIKCANALFSYFESKSRIKQMSKCERDVIRLFWRVFSRAQKPFFFSLYFSYDLVLIIIIHIVLYCCWHIILVASCVEHHLIWICDVFDLCLVLFFGF